MTPSRFTLAKTLLPSTIIILTTFACYFASLTNFFYGDDLIWLDRIRHLSGNWSEIFSIENRYFTPLTYLSFYVHFLLFGLNAYWYHLADVLLHAVNGILLYHLALRLSGSRSASVFTALLFASSFAIPVAVLWPAARTDTIMVFFFLSACIAYLAREPDSFQWQSVFLYIMALGAKGTALVLPFVLLAFPSKAGSWQQRVKELAPFLIVNFIYVLLLLLGTLFGPRKLDTGHGLVALRNFTNGFAGLIIPERHLAGTSPIISTIICTAVFIVLITCAIRMRNSAFTVGTALAVMGVVPLLFAREYTLAGSNATVMGLLSSPGNRLYLSCAGIALAIGTLLEFVVRKGRAGHVRAAGVLVLAALLWTGYREVHARNDIWSVGSNRVRRDLYALHRYPGIIADDTVLFLYNFEGSTGFSTAMINTFFDFKSVEVHVFNDLYTDEFTHPVQSPLSRTAREMKPANARLILRCSGSPETDRLMAEGNRLLLAILSHYREMPATVDAAALPVRLTDDMAQLKQVLLSCKKEY